MTDVVRCPYVSLACRNMGSFDTKPCIVDVLVLLGLGALANVAGALGLREARRPDAYGGLALVGSITAAGTFCWMLASTDLLVVAIARLS